MMMNNQPLLQIENLTIMQEENALFRNFNLSVADNDRLGIFAPTGTGKTTLLNWLAGIMPREAEKNGIIKTEGKLVKQEKLTVSYVFQEPRLIPSVSVLKNITLPVEKMYGKDEAVKKASLLLEKLFLKDKLNSMPEKLSGGEKQRVAIARAFAYPGKLLLMDEPFHSQDEEKRNLLIELTKEIIEAENRALIIISHNKSDLDKLGCRIIPEKDFVV